MVCHHGAGYSGLTFACMAKEVTDMSKGECGVLSYDCRGHGAAKFLTYGVTSDLAQGRRNTSAGLSSPRRRILMWRY